MALPNRRLLVSAERLLRASSSPSGRASSQLRAYSNEGATLLRSQTTNLRATVFGAYGFVGGYVVSNLAGGGTQCIIPYRGDDLECRHLKVMGDLGVVAMVPFSPKSVDSIRRAIEGSDIVINLIGKDYETRGFGNVVNYSFDDTHVKIPETIAKVALEMGVSCFIHQSALAADPHALSEWSRSKARGEQAVRAVIPGATIVRPADVFGPEDRFLNLFAQLQQRLPRMPLVEGGKARVQPLFVQDLSAAIFKIAMSEDPEFMLGQTYDLAGPEEYTYREVVEYVFESIRTPYPEVANVSPAMANAIGRAIGFFPHPLITADRFLRMQADVVLDDLAPTKRLHDLGLEATSLEMPGFTFLHRYRQGNPVDPVTGRA